ncbi:unnamed protein product [Lymnaea stagnalis]|uniref:Uncharacterized protein n=1 Tax=Lymnaea stagnalis TaxID=6523 RepID=A0AAV2HSM4_LYMST
MLAPLLMLALFVLEADIICGQSTKLEWLPDDMYNPLSEPRLCGLNTDEPAYICDPNKIIGDKIHSMNWHLKDAAYNSTSCPCSTYYCENERGAVGYRIGVALVRRMALQTNTDGRLNTPEDQAQLFAHRLGNGKWNMGRCEEDIVIFYSEEDKVLAIYGGSTANQKLSPYYRALLRHKVGDRLNEGRIVQALDNLIYDIKKVLNCEYSTAYSCGLYEVRSGSNSITSSITVFLSVITAAHFIFGRE